MSVRMQPSSAPRLAVAAALAALAIQYAGGRTLVLMSAMTGRQRVLCDA